MSAKVYIIGAGPGDQGLITLRAVECLRKSEIVIFGDGINKQLLEFAPPDAEKVYLGRDDREEYSQDELISMISEKIGQNINVSILKKGDPFSDRNGSDIAQALFKEGIAFEIIPGISCATGTPAYSGIPLLADSVTSMLHYIKTPQGDKKLNYKLLSQLEGTIVLLMNLKDIEKASAALLINNKDPQTPIAVIRDGTLKEQETLVSTLGDVGKELTLDGESGNIECTAIIGEVVNLRPQLFWFEKKPLFRKRFVITRPEDHGPEFVDALESLGAEVYICPTVKISPMENRSLIDKEIDQISNYTWLIFTHVNAVRIFMERLFELGKDTRALGRLSICAIGENTADSLVEYGIIPDVQIITYSQESISKDLNIKKGDKVLLPRAASARDLLPLKIEELGANVNVVPLYEMVADIDGIKKLITLLTDGAIDGVTFTSSSSVLAFTQAVDEMKRMRLLKDVVVASIGPITSKTLKSEGLKVEIEAKEYSTQGLVKAILEYYNITTNF